MKAERFVDSAVDDGVHSGEPSVRFAAAAVRSNMTRRAQEAVADVARLTAMTLRNRDRVQVEPSGN